VFSPTLTAVLAMNNMTSMISKRGLGLASITIRYLDENLKARLRVRAAHHGRSMEDEARDILRTTLASERRTSRNLVQSIRRRFTAIGGIELDIPSREPIRKPPEFDR